MATELQNLESGLAELRTLAASILDKYTSHSTVGELTGNKLWGEPEVEARVGGTPVLEVSLKSYGPTTFLVEGSRDGVRWQLCDTIVFSRAREDSFTYINAFPAVRVRTTAPNEITVTAGR